ncbi:hypothetical protein BSL78_17799 [Apostichopus japonicus]|uniref:Uncharacterized protein n=1 Tax=Stichopus japonicus TaxID=307972 RepID=A0A2G8KBF0_STIJA|nr:hypothetical protein BSL78_17799 [Apostichopus japonicus]
MVPFSHTSCKDIPLHSARVCPTCKQRLGTPLVRAQPGLMPFQPTPPASARLARVCNVALCPLAHKVEGYRTEFNSYSSSPGLDTHTFKEFRLLVAGHFPKTPQCPHNNLFKHVQMEMEDCHPHRTVIRCDLQSLKHMDTSDAGSLRGEPNIKNIHTPERFTLKRVNLSRNL